MGTLVGARWTLAPPSPLRLMTTPTCRFCGASLEITLVDLGATPLANAYVEPAGADVPDQLYPLHARLCTSCFLVQVDDVVPPDEIFGDYAYFSSYSDSWVEHARRFAVAATARLALDATSLVMELASNDGYLLRHFAGLGVPTLGVEPAKNVAVVAQDAGIETVVDFFGSSLAEALVADGRRADLVVANNVVAHVPDLNDFVTGIARVLAPTGVLSIEVPHLLRLIEEVAFDTIYHEHFSYFSLFTLERVLAAHGLAVFDVEELATHGGSLRVCAAPIHAQRTESPELGAVRRAEATAGITTLEPYERFASRVERCRAGFQRFVANAATSGSAIAAYGAAAKGNTFLNYCRVTDADIDYVVDRSPHKQGLLLPGSRIPVRPPEHVRETTPSYLLILPWNLRQEIAEQMAGISAWGGRFVVAVPAVEVFG